MIEPADALAPTRFIDSDNDAVRDFAARSTAGCISDREKTVGLYYAVRDSIRYDCYRVDMEPQSYLASETLGRGYGFCIPKAALLAAACRAQGIPATVGFADVRNHLATPRLLEMMGTDVFYYHGYTAIYIGGKWVKSTPAFNRELCELLGVAPLEFDGEADSIFQDSEADGRRHMEYLNYHGEFVDVPFDAITRSLRENYPNLMKLAGYSWDEDVGNLQQGGVADPC
ncbi:MAG: transglutaminase family protein [Caenibius sp.]